jgi:hypothetical protein
MNTKIVGTLAIATLIAMAVFVGTAAANGGGDIYGNASWRVLGERHNFTTTDNLFGGGDFGDYSDTHGDPPCPYGCGGRIYVVEHRETWTNGTELEDVSGGNETVPWGNLFSEMAWPTSKIYHFYTLSKCRGCTPEEPDEGKPQVRFCEGAHSNLGVILHHEVDYELYSTVRNIKRKKSGVNTCSPNLERLSAFIINPLPDQAMLPSDLSPSPLQRQVTHHPHPARSQLVHPLRS